MADLAENSGFSVLTHSHANDEHAEPRPAAAALPMNDPALAHSYKDLAALVTLYEVELKLLDESEAQQAGSGEIGAATHRALDAAIGCNTLVRRLICSPASGPSEVFAKIDAFVTVLGTVGLDKEILFSFQRSIRDDMARISFSGLSGSTERLNQGYETTMDVPCQNVHSHTSDMRSAR